MDRNRKLTRLVDETDALLAQIAGERSPEIQELRNRLNGSLERARSALGNERPASHLKVRHVAASFNDYVKGYPWLALATGVLVASTIGILATSATKRSYANDA